MKIQVIIAIILFISYSNCLVHPEVLMTETLTFKPGTNNSQWNPMLISVTSNCTVLSGTAQIINYIEQGWLSIAGVTKDAGQTYSAIDKPNMTYTTTISKDGKMETYNNGTETVTVQCDVHLFSEDE